jgi:translocation protein SEC63
VVDNEDNISDPDEDTVAGQMAQLRGQPYKRIEESSEEDTSASEASEEEASSSEDSSESSDSDSD